MAVVTKTLKSSGGDYSLMSTWESTEQTDLVSAGDSHVLECYNDWPSGLSDSVAISGWTTGASNTITIKAAAGEEHAGVIGGGFWITSASGAGTISCSQYYTVLEGIESVCTATNANQVTSSFRVTGYYCTLRRCIGKAASASSGGFYNGGSNNTYENCLSHSNAGAGFIGTGRYATLRNVTAVNNSTYGIRNQETNPVFYSSFTATNCVAYGNTTADWEDASGADKWTGTGTGYNGSGDGTEPGATGAVSTVASTDFTDYSGGDYSVSGTGSALYDAGTDLSGTFTDDITGATRSQWDIGAYEYISVGGATNPKGPLGHPLHGPFGGPL